MSSNLKGLAFVCVLVLVFGSQIRGYIGAGEQVDTGKAPANIGSFTVRSTANWWKHHAKMNDIFNTNVLNKSRAVSVEMVMPFEDLLTAGEAIPEDAFKPVFVTARTPAHLITLCPELLSTIAKKCDVAKFDARIAKDGQARLSGSLQFVPADHPGGLPASENAEFINIPATLEMQQDIPFTADTRENALRVAGLLCRALRNGVGNCVVSRVTLEPLTRRSGNDIVTTLNAKAVFTVFADPEKANRTELVLAMDQLRRTVGF
jgi:hypothetical protein